MPTASRASLLLDSILSHSTGKDSRIHGPTHWAGVAAAGHTLCELTPEADRELVLYFAMLHDSMRETDGLDPDHGARAAELAERLHESGDLDLAEDRLATLEEALTYHDKGQTSADPTIGACWDSDRLNLWRVGITPEASLMSTEGGRSLAGTEWSKYFPMFVFDWRAIFLNYEALLGLGEAGEHVYLRFGDLPEGGISQNAAFTLPEAGVSVFHGYEGEGAYRIDARRLMLGTETRQLRHLLNQGRPLFAVKGRHIAMGASGEPVLADARIVQEVTPDDRIEVLPNRTEIEECVEWWRSKRRDEPVGEFPCPPMGVALPCDRGSIDRPQDALTAYGLSQPHIEKAMSVIRTLKAKVGMVQRRQREMLADPDNADLRAKVMDAGWDLQKEMHKVLEQSKTPQQREAERMWDAHYKKLAKLDLRTRQQRIDEGERSRRQAGQTPLMRSWDDFLRKQRGA